MFDFYNNLTTVTAVADFTTTPDIFMVTTGLYDVIQDMGFYLSENETLGKWEEEFTAPYKEAEGVLAVVGIRGGTEEFEGVLPDHLQEFVPDEGCALFFL